DMFGFSISFNANATLLAVSAFRSEVTHGAVYIFQKTGPVWVQQTKLVPEQSRENRHFGFYIEFSEATKLLVISDNATYRIAYLYSYNGNSWETTSAFNSYGNVHVFSRQANRYVAREF